MLTSENWGVLKNVCDASLDSLLSSTSTSTWMCIRRLSTLMWLSLIRRTEKPNWDCRFEALYHAAAESAFHWQAIHSRGSLITDWQVEQCHRFLNPICPQFQFFASVRTCGVQRNHWRCDPEYWVELCSWWLATHLDRKLGICNNIQIHHYHLTPLVSIYSEHDDKTTHWYGDSAWNRRTASRIWPSTHRHSSHWTKLPAPLSHSSPVPPSSSDTAPRAVEPSRKCKKIPHSLFEEKRRLLWFLEWAAL